MNPFGLTDDEVLRVRAALLALPAHARKAMARTVYNRRRGTVYENLHECCILGTGLNAVCGKYITGSPCLHVAWDLLAEALNRHLTVHEETGLSIIIHLNDTGKLTTRKAVRALLALGE